MRWRRGLIVAAVVLLIVAGRLTLVSGPDDRFLAESPLPGGSQFVRLVAMTASGPLEYLWKDSKPGLLKSVLPRMSGVRLHLPGFSPKGGHPGASFVFRVVNRFGRYQPTGVGVELEESTGFRFPTGVLGLAESTSGGARGFTVSALPRRDKTLRFLIFEEGTQGADSRAVMEIPNPFYTADVPQWTAEPLPAVKKVDDLTVELRELSPVPGIGGFAADCRITRDEPTTNPISYSTWLEDATGNRGETLSPFEPVWKVHFQIEHDPLAQIRDDQILRVRLPSRPLEAEMERIDEPEVMNDLSADSLLIAGPGYVEFHDDGWRCTSPVGARQREPRIGLGSQWANGQESYFAWVNSHRPWMCLRYKPHVKNRVLGVRIRSAGNEYEATLKEHQIGQQVFLIAQWDFWPAGDDAVLELEAPKPTGVDFYLKPPEAFRIQPEGRNRGEE